MKIIHELSEQHITDLHGLYQQEWWSKARTLEDTKLVLQGSQLCIGIVDDANRLVGFTRVLTDYIFKALIFDVIIAKSARKQGLGDQLINSVKAHPKLQRVGHFELYCVQEMYAFYERHGFSTDVGPMRLMRMEKPD